MPMTTFENVFCIFSMSAHLHGLTGERHRNQSIQLLNGHVTFTPHGIPERKTAVLRGAKPQGQRVVSRLISLQAASEGMTRSTSPKGRIKTARRSMTQKNAPLLQQISLHSFPQPTTELIMTDTTTHPACEHHHLAAARHVAAAYHHFQAIDQHNLCDHDAAKTHADLAQMESVAAHQHSAVACEHSKK
jgi:hypothetical protein